MLKGQPVEVKTPGGWPVRIAPMSDGGYRIIARGTAFSVYVQDTNCGLMVSIPTERRCGAVPSDCYHSDIMQYCGIKNQVDAVSLAVAVRAIVGAP